MGELIVEATLSLNWLLIALLVPIISLGSWATIQIFIGTFFELTDTGPQLTTDAKSGGRGVTIVAAASATLALVGVVHAIYSADHALIVNAASVALALFYGSVVALIATWIQTKLGHIQWRELPGEGEPGDRDPWWLHVFAWLIVAGFIVMGLGPPSIAIWDAVVQL